MVSKALQSLNENIQASLQQALADIRHIYENVKFPVDDYCLQSLDKSRTITKP